MRKETIFPFRENGKEIFEIFFFHFRKQLDINSHVFYDERR